MNDKSCNNCVNHVVWEKYKDYDEECWCRGDESQESHFANCFNFVGEPVYDKCQYWEGQEERIVVCSPVHEEPYYVYNRDDVEIVRMGVNSRDLLKARDRIIETDADNAEAVEQTIAEIEPIAIACKKYLEREEAMFKQFMEIIMKDISKFRVDAYEDKETEVV